VAHCCGSIFAGSIVAETNVTVFNVCEILRCVATVAGCIVGESFVQFPLLRSP